MKSANFLFIMMLLVGTMISSCGSDDDSSCDTVPTLSENLVGEWKVDGESSVEFKSDGTFIDLDDPIIETSLQGQPLEFKTWSVSEKDVLIKSSNAEGTLSSTDTFTATEEECDRIVLDFFGFPYVFTRL